MRFSSHQPGHLGSVALRYRQPLGSGGRIAGSGCGIAWRLMGNRTASGEFQPSESGLRDERMQRLEAILFLAREPLSSRKLAQFATLADGTEARTLVRGLNELYDASGCAFRVEEVGGGFQLLTRPAFARWIRSLEGLPGEMRLSAPAMETLAVVSYRQPVLRVEVEAIRGVASGEILRQLMERDLVRISGRSEELGRPYLYSTTKRFLQLFGLRSLEQLPRADLLCGSPAADVTAAESEESIPSEEQEIDQAES